MGLFKLEWKIMLLMYYYIAFRKEIKKAAIIMMDVDGDLSVCNQCGFPLYDAVMASHTKYSCCSADINNFDFW